MVDARILLKHFRKFYTPPLTSWALPPSEFCLYTMKVKITFLLLILIKGVYNVQAQQHVYENTVQWKGKEKQPGDTTSLLHAFRKGQLHGHFRNFTTVTNNAPGLTDYYANATGGGIKYETAPFKHFQLGISGFFVFNTGSSDLTKPDETTKQLSRYETSLFDVADPANKNDIDRLEELYLKYSIRNFHLVFGKQLVNTPFINMQDSRMRPTEVQGIWGKFNGSDNTQVEGGFLYEISPRSTVKWYSTGESIGIYSSGVNADGSKAEYAGNVESSGIALLGISREITTNLKIQLWEQYVENIFNTVIAQLDYSRQLASESKIFGAYQVIRQDALKYGGNESPSKAYFIKGGKSVSYGVRIGWKNENFEATLNYNRITKDGRFQMPREWGTEPFFTYLSRERNEGLGDVHAAVAKINYHLVKAPVKTSLAFGYYNLPEVNDYRLNKYAMPSYNQINADAQYEFEGLLKGLEAQFLYVYKEKTGAIFDYASVINKVSLSSYNLILNYHF